MHHSPFQLTSGSIQETFQFWLAFFVTSPHESQKIQPLGAWLFTAPHEEICIVYPIESKTIVIPKSSKVNHWLSERYVTIDGPLNYWWPKSFISVDNDTQRCQPWIQTPYHHSLTTWSLNDSTHLPGMMLCWNNSMSLFRFLKEKDRGESNVSHQLGFA